MTTLWRTNFGGSPEENATENDDPNGGLSSFNIFMAVFLAVIAAWAVVALFQRFIDNLTFNTIGLDRTSTRDTGIIFLVGILFFFLFVFILEATGLISTGGAGGSDPRPREDRFAPEDMVGVGLADGRAQNLTNCVKSGTC